MADTMNPRTRLDEALAEMRDANDGPGSHEHITSAATVVCAEALSLLVDAHPAAPAPEPEPEPDPREDRPISTLEALSLLARIPPATDDEIAAVGRAAARLPTKLKDLPDNVPVGHGWVMAWYGSGLFKPYGNGRFKGWREESRTWGVEGNWHKPAIYHTRPATVGDLRRVGLPVGEWPDITTPEPEPPRAEKAEAELRARELHHFEAEQSEAKAIAERDNAIAALRAVWWRMAQGVNLIDPNGDIRKTYRESLTFVEAEARRRGIDLDEGEA